jgi:hypothetical protein
MGKFLKEIDRLDLKKYLNIFQVCTRVANGIQIIANKNRQYQIKMAILEINS